MFVRTTHDAYQQYAERYLREVISRVKDLQFYTASGNKGGPIIMTQVGMTVLLQRQLKLSLNIT